MTLKFNTDPEFSSLPTVIAGCDHDLKITAVSGCQNAAKIRKINCKNRRHGQFLIG
jgi:hypothetical protein